MPIIFTRHLYIKDEVECALLSAILLKEKDVSLFWAFELFYSGFETEVFDFIWNIYYNFHAPLNPSFEKYFIRKMSDVSISRPLILASIVTNLCPKPYTTDVYILSRRLESGLRVSPSFKTWFEMRDYSSIASHIMSTSFDDASESDMDAIRGIALKCHGIKWFRPMLLPSPKICFKMRFLSHIMQICISDVYLISVKNRLNLSSDHIVCPQELCGNKNALKTGCKYAVNCSSTLHLFNLERHNEEDDSLTRIYREDWLSHCTQTPYWSQKITEHNGTVDVETGVTEFPELEQEERFYAKYGLEPDEQPWTIQCTSIGRIERNADDSESEFCARFGTWNIAVH